GGRGGRRRPGGPTAAPGGADQGGDGDGDDGRLGCGAEPVGQGAGPAEVQFVEPHGRGVEPGGVGDGAVCVDERRYADGGRHRRVAAVFDGAKAHHGELL